MAPGEVRLVHRSAPCSVLSMQHAWSVFVAADLAQAHEVCPIPRLYSTAPCPALLLCPLQLIPLLAALGADGGAEVLLESLDSLGAVGKRHTVQLQGTHKQLACSRAWATQVNNVAASLLHEVQAAIWPRAGGAHWL